MHMPRRLHLDAHYGSHLPVLLKAVLQTDGPILELGSGLCSTPFLHWLCWVPKRRLVTYECNEQFYEYASQFKTDYHEVRCIKDWDDIDISERWSVAFIDHDPGLRRGVELGRLTHAEYVVAHDTEPCNEPAHGYEKTSSRYRYRFNHSEVLPHTSVFSNTHDVTNFLAIQ